MSTTAMEVQADVALGLKMIEGALPLMGLEDLVPLLQSLQTFETLIYDAIEQKKPLASVAIQAQIQAALTAYEAAKVAKFGNT